jgi:hypothetical protein
MLLLKQQFNMMTTPMEGRDRPWDHATPEYNEIAPIKMSVWSISIISTVTEDDQLHEFKAGIVVDFINKNPTECWRK